MATRRSGAFTPETPALTVAQKRRRIERLQECVRDLEVFDPQKVQKRYQVPEVMVIEAAIKDALSTAFREGTPAYNRYGSAAKLDHGPHLAHSDFGGGSVNRDLQDARDARQYLEEGKLRSTVLLQQAIRTLSDEIADEEPPPAAQTARGNKVFIGHGRSLLWLKLRLFLSEKLLLDCDEFAEESPAGVTTTARLQAMLDSAGFAFLLMTSEDKHADGTAHARENVIHEAGLFQGRLGFACAIILLEEGCEEFSNIHGLGQIRFPKGNIEAAFEGIREVLRREEIIS